MAVLDTRSAHLFHLIVILLLLFHTKLTVSTECQSFSNTCRDCIIEPGCAWCNNQTYPGERCDTADRLIANGCDLIENPQMNLTKLEDEELTDGVYENEEDDEPTEPAIQIRPQKIHLRVRQGEPTPIQLKMRQAQDYPVDLYYLMDLSYSMSDDLANLVNLASDIAEKMRDITRRARLGFGSFVDKPITPYIDITPSAIDAPCSGCEKTYSFRNVLPLDKQLDLFAQEVRKTGISGNLDSPEGSLDAMMQAAVCTEEIGWRPGARRLLLLTTDNSCHIQGDGKVGRVLTPNDGLCHMSGNEYNVSHLYDYPSVAFLNQKLVENNILPIFAVTSRTSSVYLKLAQLMQGAWTSTLSGTSSNIVNIIERIYDEITGKVQLAYDAPPNIEVAIFPNCQRGVLDPDGQSCSSVKLGEEVTFDVTVTARGSCVAGANNYSLQIYPVGLDERLDVEIEVICDCSCESIQEANSTYCNNGNGSLVCGTCECYEGHYGEFCDCLGGVADELADISTCRPHNQTEVMCSGRGECMCGECECDTTQDASVSGRFCECSDNQCPTYSDEICGGPTRGTCICRDDRFSECRCMPGYSGPACDCVTSLDPCIAPETGLVCNGEGTCVCGECQCESTKFYGEHCKQCVTCTECHIHINCVKCKIFQEGISEDECNMCTQNIQKATKNTPNRNSTAGFEVCSYRNSENCTVYFLFNQTTTGGVTLFVEAVPVCPVPQTDPFPIVPVIIGIILGIVLLGLLLILLYRAYIWRLDKQEYEQLLKDQANPDFQEGENPLYKKSTQTFKNPMFGKAILKT